MGPSETIDHKKVYAKRIDILKRMGRKVQPSHKGVDRDKYLVLPHGQIIKKSTLQSKRVFVAGQEVRAGERS